MKTKQNQIKNCLTDLFSGISGKIMIALSFFMVFSVCQAQDIDILLKGGHVIDPKNNINSQMDVAIADGKILKVAASIPSDNAKKVIDARGLYVTPGLIDLHTHVFVGSKKCFADGFPCISPDDITLKAGITTVVDAGTSGWRNFPLFKEQVIDRSTTRILAFLSIAGSGMTGFPSEEDVNDMDAHMTSLVIQKYPDIIVGVKIGHYRGPEWTPFDRAVEAARISDVPLFVECHMPLYSLEGILARMKPGDIYTHSFTTAIDRMCLLDDQKKIRPYVLEAQKKGIRFDVGHGGGMFQFDIAIPAMEQGLLPNSFGTDLHRYSINRAMKDMLNVMSKYMNMGMPLEDVIFRATWNSAQSIKRDDLGQLSEGAVADIAVIGVRKGSFGFIDTKGFKMSGDRKLEAELTIREGKVVWDLNGLSAKDWSGK